MEPFSNESKRVSQDALDKFGELDRIKALSMASMDIHTHLLKSESGDLIKKTPNRDRLVDRISSCLIIIEQLFNSVSLGNDIAHSYSDKIKHLKSEISFINDQETKNTEH